MDRGASRSALRDGTDGTETERLDRPSADRPSGADKTAHFAKEMLELLAELDLLCLVGLYIFGGIEETVF
jgi:hypothetical protein